MNKFVAVGAYLFIGIVISGLAVTGLLGNAVQAGWSAADATVRAARAAPTLAAQLAAPSVTPSPSVPLTLVPSPIVPTQITTLPPPPTATVGATLPPTPLAVPTRFLPTPPPPPTPSPSPVLAVTYGNGIYRVGTDIAPGTYRTRSTPGFSCYWERMRDFSGSSTEAIAAEYPDGPAIVTIAATDKGFKTDGCPPWTQDLSALKAPTAQFFGGTFFVGLEVAPGTWRTAAGAVSGTCTWARLSGFGSGDPFLGDARGDIIASGGAQRGDVYVTISATDRGFTSSRCGGWIKVG
jgi:hypothetical protein